MGCFLLLCLIISLPLLWLFPIAASLFIGTAWIVLFLIVYGAQRTTKFQVGLLTPDEAAIASQYGFYFRMPFAAANISNGASAWQMFTVVWAIYLGFRGLWWYLPIPILVHFVCAYLRTTCHPIFFAQEGARIYSGSLQGYAYASKLSLLTSIFDKLYGHSSGRENSSGRAIPGPVMEALRQLAESHPNTIALIREEVVAAIQSSYEEVKRQMDEGRASATDVARQFSCNVAGDQLEAGRHHIYRGTLTETGRDLLAFYAFCWQEDAKRGFVTEDKANEEIATLRKIVQEIG